MFHVMALDSGEVRRYYALATAWRACVAATISATLKAVSLEKARQSGRAILGHGARGKDHSQQREEARQAVIARRVARRAAGTVAGFVEVPRDSGA